MSERHDDWIDLLINCVISVVIVITVLAVKSCDNSLSDLQRRIAVLEQKQQ